MSDVFDVSHNYLKSIDNIITNLKNIIKFRNYLATK